MTLTTSKDYIILILYVVHYDPINCVTLLNLKFISGGIRWGVCVNMQLFGILFFKDM